VFGVQWWPRLSPRDFEQCSDQALGTASSEDERVLLIAECDRRFAGRRKLGGGYSYYDFLQNRHFDISGPNPTPSELKRFDEEYASYLEARRRAAVAAAFARRQSRSAPADVQDDRPADAISSPGPDMAMPPAKVPIPRARNLAMRSRASRCEDASLSCRWNSFSSGIKNFFGSSPKPTRPSAPFSEMPMAGSAAG
jgi:hypothetical protein